METEKCDICKKEKDLIEFAIIRPMHKEDQEQCHPFMEMEYICFECLDEVNCVQGWRD